MTPDGCLGWNRRGWPGGLGGQRICRQVAARWPLPEVEDLEGKGEYLESTEGPPGMVGENHAYAQVTAGDAVRRAYQIRHRPRPALRRSIRARSRYQYGFEGECQDRERCGWRTHGQPAPPFERHRAFSMNPPSPRANVPGSAMPGFHRPSNKGMSHHQPDC